MEAGVDHGVNERNLLIVVRYGVPLAIATGGLVLLLIDSDNLHGALGIIGAGIAVGLLSLFYRVGASGDRERDAEDAAREYFDVHGRWPDEDHVPGA